MERSRTQVLWSYLPEAVFVHESGVIGRIVKIRGEAVSSVNRQVILSEMEEYLSRWQDEAVQGIVRPRRADATQFQIITPEIVQWEIWPLSFECSRESCGRIVKFFRLDEITKGPRCRRCRAPLRQLRYYSAHECGRVTEMYTPKCSQGHGYEDVYFEDTGTFRTAVFRCRACNNGIIRRTLQSPCGCPVPSGGERPMMQAFTVRDTRTYHPHRVSLINLQSATFTDFQAHPSRGDIAVASYLGLLGGTGSIRRGLTEANRKGSATRISAEDWPKKEAQLRGMGFSEDQIAAIREQLAPNDPGLGGVGVGAGVIELGRSRTLVERAALYDSSEVRRITLGDARDAMRSRGLETAAVGLAEAMSRATRLGIEEIAITWSFPIAMAAFGFTRCVKEPGKGVFRGFARQGAYDGKFPIFTVATETEAVLVTLSATAVLAWLTKRGLGRWPSEDAAGARRAILEMFSNRGSHPEAPHAATVLVHTVAHALIQALEGHVGFAEASLAEWIVPETLTFAIYANNLKSYTLGSFWTLLNSRTLQWLEKAADGVMECENDPLCHQRSPRACERCMFLSLGCPLFNDLLDRGMLAGFWRDA